MAFINYVTQIQFDFGAVRLLRQECERVGITRPLIVTDQGVKAAGVLQKALDGLGDMPHAVFDQTPSNPTEAAVRAAAAIYQEQRCDGLIAVGGGSAIDTAKALIVGTESGRFDELLGLLASGKPFVPARCKALIAAPTTAGTGSEVTPWATIWDTAAQKKYSLHLECTWPKVAIIDPQLMLTVPAGVTVSTGLDALSHALESIWNVNANPISDTFALSAITDILECLPLLLRDLSSQALRTRMALAALKAGMAFSNTKTALAHSISYEMTLRHGLPHGIACSFTLPLVLGLAWGHDQERDQTLQRLFGNDLDKAQRQLRDFLHSLGVKTEFADYGVAAEDAEAIIQYALQGARGKNFIGARAA